MAELIDTALGAVRVQAVFDQDDDGIVVVLVDEVPETKRTTPMRP